jgi:hypothetical protein
MKDSLKVSDLNSIFESIQRDIDELTETQKKIPRDREYSSHVLASISEEIRKLEERKEIILNMEIKLPEEILNSIQKRLNLKEYADPVTTKNSQELTQFTKNKTTRRY